jgi:hypothetical protein
MISVPVTSLGMRSGVIGQTVDEQRLRQARDAFQERMPAGEQGRNGLLDHFVLPDDRLGQLVANAVVRLFATAHGRHIVGFRLGLNAHVVHLNERHSMFLK